MSARRVLEPLSAAECMQLLADGGLGRLVYNSRYGPTALPTVYRIDGESIVLGTWDPALFDEDLRTGIAHAEYKVAVEADQIDLEAREGWIVLVRGAAHHLDTEAERAPDIAVGALAFSSAQAGASRGLARLVFRYQAYLFFPLLLGEAVNLHVASVRALTRRAARRRSWERALITVHAAGYLTAVFLVLSPVKAVVFIIVQQGLFGLYLGSSFAPNHKGMPILDAADRSDFLRRQALTSRNVRGGRLTDFALGGLNYQIEHHLFPSMPRPNLRRSQALIEAFCRLRGVPYCQSSLAGSYAQALRYLNTVGRPARPGAASAAAARP